MLGIVNMHAHGTHSIAHCRYTVCRIQRFTLHLVIVEMRNIKERESCAKTERI